MKIVEHRNHLNMEPGLPAVSTGQSSGGQPSASLVDDQLSSKLSDVLNTNITLSSANTGLMTLHHILSAI
ncbi:hypothetical protein EB796_021422 [Bugula neritina]|uniref:Uncharacterized protein n=1 Tax=Bugula neritina TaxID=10212 RepID=A0A7J7J236_BUGNE|nr:hypothetical protein EB796_021422 [Bugula neritina]